MSSFSTFIKLLSNKADLKKAFANRFSFSKVGHLLPSKMYLSILYRCYFGKKINFKKPVTFSEKLQWLKINRKDKKLVSLVDKFAVRDYVSKKIGSQYLVPLLGKWDSVSDIDFDSLPTQFVLKCNHDSGSVVVCRNKNEFDFKKAKKKLKKCMKNNLYYFGREWPYKNVKPCILAEQYLTDGQSEQLKDYKFYCFNGEPRFLYLSEGLDNHETGHISFLTLNWEKMPFHRNDFMEFDSLPQQPVNLDLMIRFSRILSSSHPFVRVDFYEVNGKLFFGELTFYPGSGFTVFEPSKYDEILGSWINLSQS